MTVMKLWGVVRALRWRWYALHDRSSVFKPDACGLQRDWDVYALPASRTGPPR